MSVGPSRHQLLLRAGTSAMESGLICTSFMRTVPPQSGSMRMISRSRDHLTSGAQYSGRSDSSPAPSLWFSD
uniref:Neurensin 1 n=1 Tax=Pipistrellus kuhlii TaxID=59472 RepID=A0A7J8A9I2_PIPKU|nr:neurensin 1 [Pipistrellus kuhlii]